MKTMKTTKTILAALVTLAAAAATGCTKSGESASPFLGTWHADFSAVIEGQRAAVTEQVKAQVVQMRAELKNLDALPADQKKEAIAMMWAQVPEENRELVEAMMAGEKEGVAAANKMFEAKIAGLKATVEVKADNTYAFEASMGEIKETGSGSWTSSASTITLQPKMKDGKPPEGDDAKPLVLTLKDGKLEGKLPKDGEPIVLKR